MSNGVNDFKGPQGWDNAGSQNAGTWQAQQSQTSSPQQAGESRQTFQTRQAAFDSNQK